MVFFTWEIKKTVLPFIGKQSGDECRWVSYGWHCQFHMIKDAAHCLFFAIQKVTVFDFVLDCAGPAGWDGVCVNVNFVAIGLHCFCCSNGMSFYTEKEVVHCPQDATKVVL